MKKLRPQSKLFNKIQVKSFYSKKGVLENSFGFSTVTESTEYKLISAVNTKKATGLGGISAKFIRDGCSVIASPITHILNLSLSQSTVPIKAFKEARVVPIYKKGARGQVGNYSPVSIFPVVTKIFERIVPGGGGGALGYLGGCIRSLSKLKNTPKALISGHKSTLLLIKNADFLL